MSEGWERPGWELTGRAARLFYFVPGPSPSGGLRLSRSRHHVEGFPDALRVTAHSRDEKPDWFAGFFARPGLGFGMEEAFGDEAAAIAAIDEGTVLRGEFDDPRDLGYLRDSVGVVSAVLEQGGLGVLDLPTCRWWSRDAWLETFVARTGFNVGEQLALVCSNDDAYHPGLWMHTRGLRKFGRPDLQIRHVPGPPGDGKDFVGAAQGVLNSLAAVLCRGGVFAERDTLGFPGTDRQATVLLTPDDADAPACHFGNESLLLVDLRDDGPGDDLNGLLGWLASEDDA